MTTFAGRRLRRGVVSAREIGYFFTSVCPGSGWRRVFCWLDNTAGPHEGDLDWRCRVHARMLR